MQTQMESSKDQFHNNSESKNGSGDLRIRKENKEMTF
jgi:hypothetical protein